MFTGYHPDVTGYGFPVGEASRIAKKHFGGQSRDRSNAGMRHQPSRRGTLLGLLLHLAVQIVDRTLQLGIQGQ